ncbi:cytochrome P450 family protein [Streptomyces minutiscleroticus]|uniref:Cytochrome P450 hydroxylase n=1 Tax=Streptomyces minutiscleroticus TaxID=68238 RepID=A0A918KFT8_9ACTN|nr:cytochrome P450 [Streptomyces minutiscleroticus]GGX60770.1 cytochrome P450 hydroxylase [Streptomyces minutiscleroticus]
MTQTQEQGTADETARAVDAASRGCPVYRSNPHPLYRHLREASPVSRLTPPHGVDSYLITRYEDAKAALADPRISKDMYAAVDAYRSVFGDSSIALDDNMLFADPPKHTRLRRLVNRAFVPRRIEALRPRVQEITDALLDRFTTLEPVDLLSDFAFPLPLQVICELIGVPESERQKAQQLCSVVARTGFSKKDKARLAEAENGLREYFEDLIARKRKRPEDDLLSVLVQTRDEQDSLTDGELLSTLWVLLFAGHKTTAYLIGNAVHTLLTHPDQLQQVVTSPELLPNAVEEIIRFEGSVENATFRHALEDITVAGTLIPKGSLVQIAITSANRDAASFERPDTFDITRPGVQSSHLGFGTGPHYCIGAPLARMEMQIALASLFRRFPRISLARPAEEAEWLTVPFPAFRGLTRLPVMLDPSETPTD